MPNHPPLPPFEIEADYVKPDPEEVAAIETAKNELMACKEIFDGWGEQLDRRISGRMNSTEQEIRTAITKLRDDAEASLSAFSDIVDSQRTLCRIMNRRLQRAMDHDSGILRPSPEIETLRNKISSYSSNISDHVQRMVERLEGLVDFIENLKPAVKVGKTKKMWQRICRWLREAFNAVAAIFASAANACFGVGDGTASIIGGLFAMGSVISAKVTAICERFSQGNIDEYQKVDEILHFLKTTIPSEADTARNHLVSFKQEKLGQVELMIEAGLPVKLSEESSRDAQDAWDVQEGMLQLMRVSPFEITIPEC